MNFKRIGYILLTVIYFSCSSIAQGKLTIEQQQKDFQLLKCALEEAHQGLYLFNTKEMVEKKYDSIKKSITKDNTEEDFYKLIAPFVTYVGDGHTNIFFTPGYINSLNDIAYVLPYRLRSSGGKFFITANYLNSADTAVIGREIISINGKGINDFLNFAINYISSDGENKTLKYKTLENARRFSHLFYLYSGGKNNFVLELKDPYSGVIKYHGVIALTRSASSPYFQMSHGQPILSKFYPDSNAALLIINSFNSGDFQEAGINYQTYLNTFYNSAITKGIKNLIIDLRGNGGGDDDYGKILFSYLLNKKFLYYRSLTLKSGKYTLVRPMDMPAGFSVKNDSTGLWDVKLHPNIGIQSPEKNIFASKIFVLIDGNSFSTTSEFISMLHYHLKPVFIGEESGGNYYGNNSGFRGDLTLPNSGFQVSIPLMHYRMAVEDYGYPKNGIIPDVAINYNGKDIIENKDLEMDTAFKLIRAGNKKE